MEEEVPDLEVIVGTYEEFLVGYKLVRKKGTKKDPLPKLEFEQSFTNHSHSGSVRSLAMVGKYLASGSTDEVIRLINMEKRVEHGYLQQQSGTINSLTGYEGKFLFSGASDGTICIWKSGSWLCEKTLQAHKGGVAAVAIHPSGKLALSVGSSERNLKTWNLIKGRSGFVTNLHGSIGEAVSWSPEGNFYAVGLSSRVDVYAVETAKVIYSAQFGKRINRIVFINEDTIIVIGDKPEIEVHSVKEKSKSLSFVAHMTRVKDVEWVEDEEILVTASNCDQHIRLWKFDSNLELKKEPKKIAEVNTTCRVTCLAVWRKSQLEVKEEEDSDDDEDESDEEGEEEQEMEISEDEEESSDDEEEETEPAPKKSKVSAKPKPSKPTSKSPSLKTESKQQSKDKSKFKTPDAAAAPSRSSPSSAKTKKKKKV